MSNTNSSIGLLGYHSVQYFTQNLNSCVQWHEDKFGFYKIAKSSAAWERKHCMRSVVLLGAGDVAWIITEPIEKNSYAGQYLQKHPDGISFLNFRVKNIQQTYAFLLNKKAPLLYNIQSHESQHHGVWKEIAIATPLDDVGFRFVEERKYDSFAPGYQWIENCKKQPVGLELGIDHVTCNTRAMHGLTEFYKHCLGFQPYWHVEFHTSHHKSDLTTGSGLESIVMWDEESGIKFATNQPLAPYFQNSQIQIYIHDNCGTGIQHIALGTRDILSTVDQLKKRGVFFLEASDKYYAQLPLRMEKMGLNTIHEPLALLKKNNILVDGAEGKYLLQIFMKEQCIQFDQKSSGPFFYEIIQRAGAESFGEGNFKALFDSIEKHHILEHKQNIKEKIHSLC
jgi:4-hydroxyphenylpyruvate dioxygenase